MALAAIAALVAFRAHDRYALDGWIENASRLPVAFARGNGNAGGPGGTSKDEAFKKVFSPEGRAKIAAWLKAQRVQESAREDLVQLIMLEAWRSWSTFDPAKGQPEPWLYRITSHVIGEWRYGVTRPKEKHHEDVDELEERIECEAPLTPDTMDAELHRLTVLQALQLLPLDDQAILIAHDIDGIPIVEIAEQYRMSATSAYRWREQSMGRFRKLIETTTWLSDLCQWIR